MLTAEQLEVIKEEYSNMDWDDFRESAGDLITREIEIYDAVVIGGVPALVAEVERLQEMLKGARQSYNRKRKEAKVLANACRKHKVENERLRAALEYYADENHYEPYCIEGEGCDVTEDEGYIARAALAGESDAI